jgi:hypothetical protein
MMRKAETQENLVFDMSFQAWQVFQCENMRRMASQAEGTKHENLVI